MKSDNELIYCNWCGHQSKIIWIHGHGQCSHCGTNIDECCRGESNKPDPNECKDYVRPYPCPRTTQLNFFTGISFIISLLAIIVIYGYVILKKK